MAIKPGWTGRVFEDFEVGDIYEHPLGRTVTQADNIWFTCLTMNTNPIHFDAEYASQTEFKRPLVNSCFTLALVTGQSVIDLTMNAVANLGWDEVRLPNPLFEGDTVYAKSEVLETRESKSRPNVGIVQGEDDRPESARHAGHRIHAHVHDLEAGARARTLSSSRTSGSCSIPCSNDSAFRARRLPAIVRVAHARNFVSSSASPAGCSG